MKLPSKPPSWQAQLPYILGPGHLDRPDIAAFVRKANLRYWHWDKLRRYPRPADLGIEEAWALVKFGRVSQLRPFGLHDSSGTPYTFWLPEGVQRDLHMVDLRMGGTVAFPTPHLDARDRERYLINSLMEEAIASSQIEGAATTRRVAKEMLRTGRPARTRDERMILNNFRAIERIRQFKDEPLTLELILELQATMTEGTLDHPSGSGRFRTASEDIHVADTRDGSRLYTPPPALELPGRLEALILFANAPNSAEGFIHPIIRAILLHFWIAIDHPFVDGNGRTARALFYWYVLRRGYWLFEFMPLSRIVLRAPVSYGRAYLHSQHDGNDATYFIAFHLTAIRKAQQELETYLADVIAQRNAAAELVQRNPNLNERQAQGLQELFVGNRAQWRLDEWRATFDVSYGTAYNDLAKLVRAGLVAANRTRQRNVYVAVPGAAGRLRTRI